MVGARGISKLLRLEAAKPRRKRQMSKDQNSKKGLALGTIFALLGSVFAGAMPANAAPSTEAFFITPVSGTSFNTLVDESFGLNIVRNPAVLGSDDLDSLKYSITTNRTATSFSMELRAATDSGTVAIASESSAAALPNQAIFYNGVALGGSAADFGVGSLKTEIPAFVTSSGVSAVPTHSYVVRPQDISSTVSNQLSMVFGATGETQLTSISPTINVTVTAFLDTNGNNIFDAASEVSATVTVNFLKYSAVGASASTGTIVEGGTYATTSATIPLLNLNQLDGKWAIRVSQWNADGQITATSYSQLAERTVTDASYAAGAFSNSQLITAAVAGHSISSEIVYIKSGSALFTGAGVTPVTDALKVIRFGASSTQTLAAAKATGFTVYAVEGDNVSRSSASQADVRPNKPYTLRVTVSAIAGSATASIPVNLVFGGVTDLSTTKYASVNGGTADTSGTLSGVALTTNASGVAEAVISTTGFGTGDDLTVTVTVPGATSTTYTLNAVDVVWSVELDATVVATAPATAVNVGATVYDQFGVASTRTDQRLKFSWTSGYSGTATNSFAVLSAGKASAMMTPSRVPTTGSAQVTVQLQSYDSNLALWSDVSGKAAIVAVTVTDNAAAFRTGLAASYSASISYGTDYSWSSAINEAYVLVTGSPVVISGAGLMFKVNSTIAADSITVPGNSTGEVSFQVTSRLAGTYTVTLTVGAATTTSQIVVSPARSDAGTTITWDTTAIEAGRTKIVVGTLTDANGNPVYTDGPGNAGGVDNFTTASMLVTYAGTAGIPVGTMPTETDADGKFRVSILTSGSDNGSFTLTAVYSPYGSTTAVADKVSSVNTIVVGENVVAADQKITVGSFKGYIAIYTKGYMGQKLSAKVAGKWLVVDPIAAWQGNDYSRVVRLTGAGYTILVHLYIDGEFVRSETIVTK